MTPVSTGIASGSGMMLRKIAASGSASRFCVLPDSSFRAASICRVCSVTASASKQALVMVIMRLRQTSRLIRGSTS